MLGLASNRPTKEPVWKDGSLRERPSAAVSNFPVERGVTDLAVHTRKVQTRSVQDSEDIPRSNTLKALVMLDQGVIGKSI